MQIFGESYCNALIESLAWMFHSGKLNDRINEIHKDKEPGIILIIVLEPEMIFS